VHDGKRGPGSVRIISGRWRGRRIPVPEAPDLRPTPDRVRETLYNWLQGRLPGSRILDLYAGSGALGLEAVSRGAAHATLVEREPAVAAVLRASVAKLGATAQEVVVVEADARAVLAAGPARLGGSYDLVLLDPPFAAAEESHLCTLLAQGGWLAESACVYLEGPSDRVAPDLPAGWQVARTLTAGAVTARLLRTVT
jgi:16S rRNA (guanine966-N2)-methyltransferase